MEWGTYRVPGSQNPQKKYLRTVSKCLKSLVGAPRFELGTSCSQSRRATRLRHAPISVRRDSVSCSGFCCKPMVVFEKKSPRFLCEFVPQGLSENDHRAIFFPLPGWSDTRLQSGSPAWPHPAALLAGTLRFGSG